MLPPLDPAIVQRNPNFEVLYKDLCTRKLNPDGSTRDTKKQRVHDEIRRSLTIARTNYHSSQILIDSLSSLSTHTTSLPPDLHSPIETTTALLTHQIPSSDRDILTENTTTFLDNISPIATTLSTHLAQTATHICTIANPTNPPTFSNLNATAASLQENATISLPQSLQHANQDLANTLTTLLTTHLLLLTHAIRILEQTQHGALTRHTHTTSEHMHTRATLLALQAKIHMLAHPPPAEFVAALKEFRRVQGSGERGLRDREMLAKKGLELYGKAGEKGMRDLARRKVWIEGEIERVEGEIGELERGGK